MGDTVTTPLLQAGKVTEAYLQSDNELGVRLDSSEVHVSYTEAASK